jgi:glyoxylase-like metal-dependent hydrolase (beta-lactamase superfamily II)
MLPMYLTLHFDHCGGVQWNAEKTDMSLLSKTLNSGVMKPLGMGNKPNPRRKHLSFRNILPMRRTVELQKDLQRIF